MSLPARSSWLALVSLLLASCSGESAPTDRFEITGRVSDAITDEGIADAEVTFRSDTLLLVSTTSNGSGTYRMTVETDVPFGQLRAEKEGWLADEVTVFFDTPTRRVDLELREAAAP